MSEKKRTFTDNLGNELNLIEPDSYNFSQKHLQQWVDAMKAEKPVDKSSTEWFIPPKISAEDTSNWYFTCDSLTTKTIKDQAPTASPLSKDALKNFPLQRLPELKPNQVKAILHKSIKKYSK